MKKYGVIYKITNLKTGQAYIGQTVNSVRSLYTDSGKVSFEIGRYDMSRCSELAKSLNEKGLDLRAELNDLAANQRKFSENQAQILLSVLPYMFHLKGKSNGSI